MKKIESFEVLGALNANDEVVECRVNGIDDTKSIRVPKQRTEIQKFLSELPRCNSCLTHPQVEILGNKYYLGHAYQTDQERQAIKDCRGSGTGTKSSDGSVRLSKDAWELLVSIGEKSKDPDLLKFIEANKPVDPAVAKARAALAALTPEQRKLLGLPE